MLRFYCYGAQGLVGGAPGGETRAAALAPSAGETLASKAPKAQPRRTHVAIVVTLPVVRFETFSYA